MSTADLTAARADICRTVAALGDLLDSLTVIEELERRPDGGDAPVLAQHLDEAASAAEQAAAHLEPLVAKLDLKARLARSAVRMAEGGAA